MDAADIHVSERRKSACSFLFLIWTFQINLVVGLKWTTNPPPITKCVGHDVTFMWTFEEEAGEEIRQLQFLVNSTKLIAYKSVRNGFYVSPEYKGRVEVRNETGRVEARNETGRVEVRNETGILLKNISAKDTGTYTLYPIIAREESPNIQSIWLNVIETTREQWCTCRNLSLLTEWSSGQSFSIVAKEGCHLEINSSFCCPKGPAIEYCESDPQKLCVLLSNLKSTTQSSCTSSPTESTTESRFLNELINDKKDPIFVQIGGTEPDSTSENVAVATLILTLLLVFFCISMLMLFWKLVIPLMARKQEKKTFSD